MFKDAQEAANTTQQSEMHTLECNWVGKYPYMQLIHCLVDNDNIKHAYLCCNDIDPS